MSDKSERSKAIFTAVATTLAANALLAASAMAQFQVGGNGHANDVNNRVGSGGYNTPTPPPSLVTGNQIVTGNVTGDKAFRGFVPYTDPGAFRGAISGSNVDRFIARSAGTPIGTYSNNNAQVTQGYYGNSYGAPPPAGYSGGITSNGQFLPNLPLTRGTAAGSSFNGLYQDYAVHQLQTGQTILPGPLDANNQPTVVTASPLYGVRQWNTGDVGDQQFLNNYTDVSGFRRTGALDQASIERMRSELVQNNPINSQPQALDRNGQPLGQPQTANTPGGVGALNSTGNPGNAPGTDKTNGQSPNSGQPTNGQPNGLNPTAPLDSSVIQPTDSSNNPSGVKPVDAASAGSDAQTNSLGQQGLRNSLIANEPRNTRTWVSQNSPQYLELQRRLDVYRKGQGITADAEANRDFNEQRRAMAEAKNGKGANPQNGTGQPGQAGQPRPGTAAPGQPNNVPMNPSGPTQPDGSKLPTIPPASANQAKPAQPGVQPTEPMPGVTAKERPLMVDSFVRELKPSQVTTLMTDAEKLMKDGKFSSALDKYDMVDQVAPNDPLAFLGRATAELGASYYTRADAHLRDAFTRNPALLMGQYDLRVFLGNERLNYLIKDLKDIAKNDAKQPRPAFLLAYIYYNVGDERRAAGYLDLAEKRAGGSDKFYQLIRQHWSLPSDAGPADDMNK